MDAHFWVSYCQLDTSVVLSINGVVQPAVVATDEKWTVEGLTLAPGDTISVTAQSNGDTVNTSAAATTVTPTPLKTAEPIISRIVTAADKTISGTAPAGARIVLNVNGVAQPAVVATGGNWIVPNLTLVSGDTITVTARCAGEQ